MTRPKINFCDQYDDFNPQGFALFKFLVEKFGVILSNDPEYLIVGPYGFEHLKHNCVKIFWTGESIVPDFNLFDYAIGFDHLEFGDRYIRVPLYPFRKEFVDFRNLDALPRDEDLLNRDFCSFVVSNGSGDPIRADFFRFLCKYKMVSSGGRYLNNIGSPVADKSLFTRRHKFTIAFENAQASGYVTEKIMDAFAAWTIPIYWGAPDVETDFNPQSFIWVKDRSSFRNAIEEIEFLDKNDNFYLEKCKCNPLNIPSRMYYWDALEIFFRRIFEQGPEESRRLMSHGRQESCYRPILRQMLEDHYRISRVRHLFNQVLHLNFGK